MGQGVRDRLLWSGSPGTGRGGVGSGGDLADELAHLGAVGIVRGD